MSITANGAKYANWTYAVEAKVYAGKPSFDTVEEASDWMRVAGVWVSVDSMSERFSRFKSLTWRRGGTGSRSMYFHQQRQVALGREAPLWVAVHEVAHHLAYLKHGHTGHGTAFRHEYVNLAREELGPGWANRLSNEFDILGMLS